ncbi:FMN-dependent NADH-azoreductase [Alicyclobacillus pomorum]|uniref:FMN-dependent NADH-azoreductase n=1 Tax=Alicyclobacillus pomorum TaxID=204470 RepID=UPI00041FF7FC|nr:FMN-dependent NADH-azoreductase [Alicyclobacillus pomorum]
MAKLLYITANPKPVEASFGLKVGQAFLEAYREENPKDEIVELNLFQMNIPEIDGDVLSGWDKLRQGTPFESLNLAEQDKITRINELTEQFVGADKYVFVSPMWNLSIPPRLKAFIDTIMIAGKTFKYTENGPVGLLMGRKAVHIQARGGIYSEGPGVDMEFGDRYLRAVLAFIGITDVETIAVEGMAFMPEKAQEIQEKAIVQAKEVAKRFAKDTAPVES